MPMHGHSPPVERLQLHLPDQQMLVFDATDDIAAQMAQDSLARGTTLTAFFDACQRWPDILRDVIYPEAPKYLTWNKRNRRWGIRQRGGTIGRVYFAGPQAGERYYLRLLLYKVPCPTSFEHLRTVDGTVFPTYRAACIALGLLDDDSDLETCLEQAALMASGSGMRRLFVIILMESEPSDPERLWSNHWEALSDDLIPVLRDKYRRDPATGEERKSLALCMLRDLLDERGKKLDDFGLPAPSINFNTSAEGRVILEETSYDTTELARVGSTNLESANNEQRAIIQRILLAARQLTPTVFFLDGPGGCGKTFVENTVAAVLRGEGEVVLMVGSSGICAILLKGGRTGEFLKQYCQQELSH